MDYFYKRTFISGFLLNVVIVKLKELWAIDNMLNKGEFYDN